MWEKVGIEGNCVRFVNPSTNETFLMDSGLCDTGDYDKMKDPSTTVKALCKVRLPRKNQKKYPAIIHIKKQDYIQEFVMSTSCNTMKELADILQSIFDDQREFYPKGFTWFAEFNRKKMPLDAVPGPRITGIIL